MNLKCNRRRIVLLAIALISLSLNWLSVVLVKPINDDAVTKITDIKYILQFNGPVEPFIDWEIGQDEFKKRECKFKNCYITPGEILMKSIADYDAIAFMIPGIAITFPRLENRSIRQMYVFVAMESAQYFPLCAKPYDGLFNWTWTHRLDSNFPSGYIVVRNINGDIIGPNRNMNWIKTDHMKAIDEAFRKRLQTKSIAAAWFVSDMTSLSRRENFVMELRAELARYNLQLDIFNKRGDKTCPRKKMPECLKIIEKDYYFYLALENSFDEDYVTEKLLLALQHNAIPVVYGGANYTR